MNRAPARFILRSRPAGSKGCAPTCPGVNYDAAPWRRSTLREPQSAHRGIGLPVAGRQSCLCAVAFDFLCALCAPTSAPSALKQLPFPRGPARRTQAVPGNANLRRGTDTPGCAPRFSPRPLHPYGNPLPLLGTPISRLAIRATLLAGLVVLLTKRRRQIAGESNRLPTRVAARGSS